MASQPGYVIHGGNIEAGGVEIPLAVVLSWPKPNYVDPAKHTPTTIIWAAVFGTTALVTAVARLWSRFRLQRNAGADDWMFLASLPFACTLVALTIVSNRRYYNKHIWDLRPQDSMPEANIAWWLQLEYAIVTGLIKQSILLFYLRIITRTVSRKFRITVWTCIVVQAITTIVWFFLIMFSCFPVSAYWERFNIHSPATNFVCPLGGRGPIVAMSVISIVEDFICATLPFLVLRNLKISRRQKYALYGIFVLAYGICGCGVARVVTIFNTYYLKFDLSWLAYDLWNASMIEVLVALIVSSMPALKYYFRNYFDESRSSAKSKSGSGTTNMQTGLSSDAKRSKPRTMSYILTSLSEEELMMETPLAKEVKETSVVEVSGESSTSGSTPAIDIEEQWVADPELNGAHQRSASCVEQELRETGILKKDPWVEGWDGGKILRQGDAALESQLLADGIMTPQVAPTGPRQDYFTEFNAVKEVEESRAVAKEPSAYDTERQDDYVDLKAVL